MDPQDDRDARTELLQSLASCYEDYKDFNPRKVEGTCEWFFDDDTFRTWRESNTSALLWVSAGPGCGKSVLSRAMIDESWRLSSGHITAIICYFFFKDGNEDQMTSTGALRAILHQLLAQDTTNELMKIALRHFRTHGKNLMLNFSALWNVLIECARSCHLVCVLDALDECETESRRKLIDKLLNHFQSLARGSNPSHWIKFLITSRPYDNLEASFRRLTSVASYLRLDGDDKHTHISADIDRVIDARLEDITNGFKKEHRDAISHRLKSAENRTYLWLYLTFDIIQRSPSEYGRLGDIEGLLSTIPSQVSDAYECILQRSKDRERATILLQIVLAAMRPLTLDEANIALTSALTNCPYRAHTDLCDALWPRDTFKVVVRNVCGLFVSVYDSKLFFIHQTAREFLISFNHQGQWGGRLKLPEAHNTMLQVCQAYLNLEDLRQQSDNVARYNTKAHLNDEFPFRPYAARNWLTHCQSADDCITDQAARGVVRLFELDRESVFWENRYYSSWHPYPGPPPWWDLGVHSKDCNGVILASFLGLGSIVEYMLAKENINVNELVEPGHCSALYVASVREHIDVVRILLEHGAEVDMVCGEDRISALSAASMEWDQDIMRILLEHGAHVDLACGENGNSALLSAFQKWASDCSSDIIPAHAEVEVEVKVMELLLKHHADVNFKNKHGQSALHFAAAGSRYEAARLLLRNGADIDVQDKNLDTALHVAARTSACNVVQLLLDSGANSDIRNSQLETPLQLALGAGNNWTYQMERCVLCKDLFEGDDVEPWEELVATPLHQASKSTSTDRMIERTRNSEMAQILIKKGANVFIPEPYYGTTLQAAIAGNVDTPTIQLLLDKGVSIDHLGEGFGTALRAASRLERIDVVDLLLDNGADINLLGGRYGTALCAASYTGSVETVNALLKRGAEINPQGSLSESALQVASRLGNVEVVQLLLDKGVNVNLQGGPHGTALGAASFTGSIEIVKALLKRGAEINPQGPNSGAALRAAAESGNVEVVKILLERGADVNLEDQPPGTALQAATRIGHVEVVRVLLEHGAHVNTQAGRYGTTLQAVKDSRNPEIIRMLFINGVDTLLQGPAGEAIRAAILKDLDKLPRYYKLLGFVEFRGLSAPVGNSVSEWGSKEF
ncbi:uncharacterized protein E0L32_009790 [Thyridium curvatum]|uniref:Uncharacterized protein n=1 Tax=Thyridium curvatum TaxID=1093900 RepID=A0A507AV60_9PEZI|nr:uncharacterized protein E0L32_009790 [Thyridium curvatum]TPX08728.1 hypothetical protein E0L32_009790 [Thyridium curvatum]